MGMQTWAEKEVELACKRELTEGGFAGGGLAEGGWDYGCACCESALKAFKSLLGDNHSGCSIKITKFILNRLIDGKPLTPIEDTDDVWADVTGYQGDKKGYTCYQNKRMSSLFKYVYDDGCIKYRDLDAFCCVDIQNQSCYHSGLVQDIIDEMFPISMPYMPTTEPIKVYCSECLTDRKHGDFDTVAVFYAVKPDGERVEINKFFKHTAAGWVEIDNTEYASRQALATPGE